MAVWYRDAIMGMQWKRALPLYGAGTTIKKGAFIQVGLTDGTNEGFGVVCGTNTSLATKFIGITEQAFVAATLDNDPSAGTKYILTDCNIGPGSIYLAQYDNALTGTSWTNGLAVTGVGATTVVTSGENLGGGWLFFDNFELRYVLSSSSGTYTTKSSTSAAITTANKVAKIMYPFAKLATLTTDATQIGIATAAAGAEQFTFFDNLIKAPGFDYISLDPTKHDGVILPSAAYTPQIWAEVMCTQHYLGTHS
jgi:hypothetical protein